MRHELVRHELVVNGLDGPMRKLLGCSCGRCMSPGRQANTSASLLSYEGETLVHHLLIDAGAGVADSLLANPSLRGERARLDGILLTHWHPDHTINLNQLVVSYRIALRNRGVVSTEEMPRIRLFLDNLWDASNGELETYRYEVRITFLHELGHYLGLDEEEVAALGLA